MGANSRSQRELLAQLRDQLAVTLLLWQYRKLSVWLQHDRIDIVQRCNTFASHGGLHVVLADPCASQRSVQASAVKVKENWFSVQP